MINVDRGKINFKGKGVTILAEYMALTQALLEKMGEDVVSRVFIESCGDDNLMVVKGQVHLPDHPEYVMIDLAFILNAITETCGNKAETIIKSAADMAMQIKPDGERCDVGAIIETFDKALDQLGDE